MELFDKIETLVLTTVHTIYDAWGWSGVAILLAFENATSITPSEIILGLAGWTLIAQHQLPPSMVFLGGFYSAVGSTIGASITYWIARLGGRPMIDQFARWVRINPGRITQLENLFRRWGPGLVLVGRVIPGIRTLISIPAGLARMSYITFLTATFIGAYVWCTLLISAGYFLGHEWPLVSGYLKQALPYLLAGGAMALILYFWFSRRSLAARYALVKTGDD